MEKNVTHKSNMASSWEHFQTSVSLCKQYLEPIILIGLLPSLTLQLGAFLNFNSALGRGVYFTGALWLLVSLPAVVCLELHGARRETIASGDLYREGLRYFFRIIGVGILTGILVLLGLLLFVIPGLILIRRYALAPYYVVDKNLGVIAAMRQSAADSKLVARYIWSSLGIVAFVSVSAALIGLIFSFLPGISEVITSVLSLTGMFVLALRYSDITRSHAKTTHTSSSNL